ncbi:MAG: serine/threonine-protein kinase [Planctomycetota bacterium]|nr:serine/threonine-protein kinase [Planctomycetota bacterium]
MCAQENQPDASRPDPDSGLIDAAYDQVVVGLGSSARAASDKAFASRSPDSFAGYRVVKEIHRGGQGVVYEAIQESTRRSVAIKVMHEGPLTGARDRARFEREVHILGQLRHPNIVTIHDSGSSESGFFFVMDYIRGEPLDAFVTSRKLSVRETLKLFATVCEAVNVAHLRGVIHRDLKPGNVRVDPAGQPHVLDFGLAKLTEFDTVDDSRNDARTTTGQFVGSLPWASPEQVEARPGGVDVRSDVYSLGVMLYQSLTGRFPYKVVGNIRDVLENICNAEPARPKSIRSRIDDEVGAIVLRCLHKDKEKRYQSAGELAREIQRYLAGEPIEAKRDSGWYVFRKTLRRYRGQAVVVSMAFVFAVAAAVSLAVWYQREKGLRADAERQEAVALAVVDFLTKDVLSAVRPYKGEQELTAREMFDEAAAKVAEGAFADQPLVEAEIRSTLGTSYRWLGILDDATSELRKALDVFRRELGDEHEKTLKAMYHLGGALYEMGELDEAEPLLAQAVQTQRRVLGPDHLATLGSENDYAGLLKHQGKLVESEALLRQIL